MKLLDTDVWEYLRRTIPSKENLTARYAIPDISDRLLCAVDSAGRRHLLIPLIEGQQVLRDARSRGFTVLTRDLVVRGQGERTYIDIECQDIKGHLALDIIAAELAERLAENNNDPAQIVKDVLAKWRKFWRQLPSEMLSRERLLGLFGELWFLLTWLLPFVGAIDTIKSWRGPSGARHDFEWMLKSVEVKTTTSTRGKIHRINGIDQLIPPETGDLFFFSLRIREERGASNSLPLLIDKIIEKLVSHEEASSRFENSLVQAGYNRAHKEEYMNIHFRIVEEALFHVQSDFPRITPSQFINDVPIGIEQMDYDINLNTYNHLCIAERPDKAKRYLK